VVNTNNNKQSGFGIVVGIIAAVLVIALLGLIGWRMYGQFKQNTSATPNTQTTSPNASGHTQPTDPNAGYFVIKEWGVRFKPVSGLDGLEYVMKTSISRADFTTQQLAQADPTCDASEASGFPGLGGLSRYATNAEQPITGATFLTTINGYKYYYGGGGAPCADSTTNATATNLLSTEKPELVDSLRSLEAAK